MAGWELTSQEQERLNPPIIEVVADEEGQMYHSVIDDSKWLYVGHIPTPQTTLGWFVYHFIHGLAMGYPARKVLLFSIEHALLGPLQVEIPDPLATNGDTAVT